MHFIECHMYECVRKQPHHIFAYNELIGCKTTCKMFLAVVAILALVCLPSSHGDNTTLPLYFPLKVTNSNQQAACPPSEVLQMLRVDIVQEIQNLIQNTTIPAICHAAESEASPAASCSALPTSCSSGYYWVRSHNGTAVQVYCNTDRVCGCNSTGGWTRVA